MNAFRCQVFLRPKYARSFQIRGRPSKFGKVAQPFRRADIPDEQLEANVRPCLDAEGSYSKGMLPETLDEYTHHDASWSDGGASQNYWSFKKVFTGLAMFFGTLFVLRSYWGSQALPNPVAERQLHNVEEEWGGPGKPR